MMHPLKSTDQNHAVDLDKKVMLQGDKILCPSACVCVVFSVVCQAGEGLSIQV